MKNIRINTEYHNKFNFENIKPMENPFLNTDRYSIVRQFRKAQQRNKSKSAIKLRTRSQPPFFSLSHNSLKPAKHDACCRKYFLARKKVEEEGAKLYGLDSLRYYRQLQTKDYEQNKIDAYGLKKSHKKKSSVLSLCRSLKTDSRSMMNIKKSKFKRVDTFSTENRGSVLSQLLQIKMTGGNVDEYESDEDRTLLGKSTFTRRDTRKSEINLKKISFGRVQKQLSNLTKNNQDYFTEDFNYLPKMVMSATGMKKYPKQKKIISTDVSREKEKELPPGLIMLRGKCYTLFERIQYDN